MAGSHKGFTLIEALVTATILTIMSVASMSMLLMSVTTARANSQDTHAVALAEQEKEDIRSIDYTVIAALTVRDPYPATAPDCYTGTKVYTNPPTNTTWTCTGGISFTVHSAISANQPAASMSTITTTVSWSYKGVARNYVLRSVYANING